MQQELKEVLGTISKTGRPFLNVGRRFSNKLISQLEYLLKKHKVSKREVSEFEIFSKENGGKLFLTNVPMSEESVTKVREISSLYKDLDNPEIKPSERTAIETKINELTGEVPELKELNAQGINFVKLPKLDDNNHIIPIAVSDSSKVLYQNWLKTHINKNLVAGIMDKEALDAFTNGNYEIFNIWMDEGSEAEAKFIEDIKKYNCTVAFLPNLKEDDTRQIAVPKTQLPFFKKYLEYVRSDLKHSSITEDTYINSGNLTSDELAKIYSNSVMDSQGVYMVNDDPGISTQEIYTMYDDSTSGSRFWDYKNNDDYRMITINNESLTEDLFTQKLKEQFPQYYVSRIPGTFGDKQADLLVPKNLVFNYAGGQSHAMFIPKGTGCSVISKSALKEDSDIKSCIEKWDFERLDRIYHKQEENLENLRMFADVQPEIEEAIEAEAGVIDAVDLADISGDFTVD